jgi:carbonic anhydrase
MLRLSIVVAVLAKLLQSVHAAEVTGWTYAETSSSCAGTVADPCGPEYWDHLPDHAGDTCGEGHEQSPVNIVRATPNYELRMPEFHVVADGCDVGSLWIDYCKTSFLI